MSNKIVTGQVLKPLERGTAARHQNDPLPGRIRYRDTEHSSDTVEIPFGDKDQKGDFTLRYTYKLFLFISIFHLFNYKLI